VAKREVNVWLQPDGCNLVTYEINVENLGNTNIQNLQVEDDLNAAGFGSCGTFSINSITSDDFVINPNYNGDSDINLLSGNDVLAVGDKGAILFTVEACSCPSGTSIMNTATGTGTAPNGSIVLDESVSGSDPDPDGNGESVTDENSTTDFILTEEPDLGLAKREVGIWLQADGCYLVEYEINIENLGNTPILNLQAEDDLAAAGYGDCGSFDIKSLTSDDFIVNPSYDGSGDINLLSGTDVLEVGDKGAVLFTVEACGCPDGTMITNSASGSGTSPGGTAIEDESSSGSNPDPDGNGEDGTDESDTTNSTLSEDADMGIAKRAVNAVIHPDGCTEVIFEFNIENLGNVDLLNLQVEDDLIAAGIASCEFTDVFLTSDEFTVNPNYDGETDINMLVGMDNVQPGDVGSILMNLRLCGCPTGTTIMNSATATATSPGGTAVDDMSSNGSDPDPDGNGEDGTDESSTTDVELMESPDFGVAKREVNAMLMENGCALVTYEINVENLGNVALVDLQVEDDLNAAGFGACGVYEIKSLTSDDFIVNPNYNGSTDVNLLSGVDILEAGDKGAILFTIEACGCPDGTMIIVQVDKC